MTSTSACLRCHQTSIYMGRYLKKLRASTCSIFYLVQHTFKITVRPSACELHLFFTAEGFDQNMNWVESPSTAYSEM